MRSKILGLLLLATAAFGAGFLLAKTIHSGKGFAFAFHSAHASATPPPIQLSPASYQKPKVPSGSETYTVSQPATVWPKIVQATINPPAVHVGNIQHLDLVVEDDAQITVVDALIQTDHGTTTLPLHLNGPASADTLIAPKYALDGSNHLVAINDTNKSLVNVADADLQKLSYSADWTVTDTHDTFYKTTFLVQDASGRQNSITLDWSDACGIPNSGGVTISGNCTESSLDGVQGGNMTVSGGTTLTINSEFAITPGNSFTVNGSVVMGGSGSIVFKTLYMTDADGDGYPAATTVYDTSAAGRVARASVAHPTLIDCNDASASVYQNLTGYEDFDNDGVTTGGPQSVCSGASLAGGYLSYSNGNDCNDSNGTVWQYLSGYTDADGDGRGTGSVTSVCSGSSLPAGYSSNNTDCDDTHANVFQTIAGSGAYSIDQDQDGWIAVGLATSQCVGNPTSVSGRTYYAAYTGGYDILPTGQALGFDCNDGNASVYYNFPEYHDNDGDGYGAGSYVEACKQFPAVPDSGYSLNSNDCDDSDSSVNPGQGGWFTSSGSNGWDYNCSGGTDYEYNYGSGSCTGEPDSSCPGGAYPGACQNETTGWYGGAPSCGSAGLYLSSAGTSDYQCNASYYITQACH